MKTRIWYTADGRDIQLRQMSDEHITRCICLIQWRRTRLGRLWRMRYLEPLLNEQERRSVTDPVTKIDRSRSPLR